MLRQLIYCTVAITIFGSIAFGQKTLVKPRKASIIYCDSSTLNSYRTELANDKNRWDTTFIRKFFAIIHKFNGKPLDTTIITIGKLDENGSICKIRTRVYYYDSTVFVESRLTMNHKLLWKYSFKDPWSGGRSGEPKLFNWETRNPWVYFTCGVFNGPPEFVNDYETGLGKLNSWDSCWYKNVSLNYFKKNNIHITEKQFQTYLTNFKGDLFTFGDFLTREAAFIWYSPAKCFILFYAP